MSERDLYCYVCLIKDHTSFPAITMVKGTAVCMKHIRSIANVDVLGVERRDGSIR